MPNEKFAGQVDEKKPKNANKPNTKSTGQSAFKKVKFQLFAPSHGKRHVQQPLPTFRPMSTVAKRLDGSIYYLHGTEVVGLGPG